MFLRVFFTFVTGVCLYALSAPTWGQAAINKKADKALTDVVSSSTAQSEFPIPQFKVDASWPTLPDDWLIGQIPGLAIDANDNVWILHRPQSLSRLDLGLSNNTGMCCKAAPPVIQFSPEGKVLNAWGGPEISPTLDGVNQWPRTVHGLFVDNNNSVWLGGNGDDDHVILNFDAKGNFIRQFGRRGVTEGNLSEYAFGNPADVFHNTASNKLFIADGYINKRVSSFDTKDNSFVQFWGAYANQPGGGTREGNFDVSQATANSKNISTKAQNFGDIVHCVVQSKDGRIYVCDRRNNRIQVFKENETGQAEFLQDVIIKGDTRGLGTASDIAFSPDNKYMYVADMMNGRIWILAHSDYEVLGSFGRPGRYAGQFTWLHSIEVDSQGNVYTSEVSSGRRVQKFVLTGYK